MAYLEFRTVWGEGSAVEGLGCTGFKGFRRLGVQGRFRYTDGQAEAADTEHRAPRPVELTPNHTLAIPSGGGGFHKRLRGRAP